MPNCVTTLQARCGEAEQEDQQDVCHQAGDGAQPPVGLHQLLRGEPGVRLAGGYCCLWALHEILHCETYKGARVPAAVRHAGTCTGSYSFIQPVVAFTTAPSCTPDPSRSPHRLRLAQQTKETLTLRSTAFGSKCELPTPFMDKVLKAGLSDSIIKFAEFKSQKDLKKGDGCKRSRLTGKAAQS